MPQLMLVLILCMLLGINGGSALAEKNLLRPPGTTRYRAMTAELRRFAHYDQTHGSHRLSLTSMGQSLKGRALWLVTLRDPGVDPKTTRRVFYLCRQHGHEPASTEAALQFIRALVMATPDSEVAKYLRLVTVYVVPMANPDGAEAFLRHNAHNADINRDWIERREPETRALYRTILAIMPDVVVDQHEMYPDDPRGDLTEVATLGSGAPPGVIAVCKSLQDYVDTALGLKGYTVTSHWVDDLHPARLAHRYWAVRQGIPAILLESARHEGSGRTVADRSALHLACMNAVLEYLAGKHVAAPVMPPVP